jgi:hypothetical protein
MIFWFCYKENAVFFMARLTAVTLLTLFNFSDIAHPV